MANTNIQRIWTTQSNREFPKEIDKIILLVNKEKEPHAYKRLINHVISRGIPLNKISVCSPTWGDELSNETIFKVYHPYGRAHIPTLTFKARCLTKGEISLVLNFYFASIQAIQDNLGIVIFLESDVWLCEDFIERLSDLMIELKDKPWDYVSLGEGVKTRPPASIANSIFSPTKVYTPPHQFVFRCTDSMLFKVDYLKKIVSTLIPFHECLDWELNVQNMIHKGNVLWADPPLVEQGTMVSRVASSLAS